MQRVRTFWSSATAKLFSQLGLGDVPAIGGGDYDLLFVVTKSDTKPELTTLHYCPSAQAPSKGTGEMPRMR